MNITTLGDHVSGVQVKDETGRSLPKLQYRGVIAVQTLGQSRIVVNYTSTDLTEKSGTLWTFRVTSDRSINIRLPEDSTIYSISPNPEGMSGSSDSIYLTLPKGNVTVVYRIGIIGTKDHALTLLTAASEKMAQLQSNGIVVSKIETVLTTAFYAYENKQYVEAEEYANKVQKMCDQTLIDYEVAKRAISNLDTAINDAEIVGVTQPDEVTSQRDQANGFFTNGEYNQATVTAVSALKAVVSEVPVKPSGNNIGSFVVGGFLVVVLGYVFMNRRQEINIQVDASTDVEVLPQYSSLRFEDREIVKYLHTNKGSYTKEIRERFDLPKSTMFRTIRRLEGMGIITVERIGRQDFIKLTYEDQED